MLHLLLIDLNDCILLYLQSMFDSPMDGRAALAMMKFVSLRA